MKQQKRAEEGNPKCAEVSLENDEGKLLFLGESKINLVLFVAAVAVLDA